MRILHTADWHLGRLFHHVSLVEDQRLVLQQIADYVVEYEVDVLVVAGDIYDRAIPPVAAVRLLNEFINALRLRSDVKIIVISGNHDNAERLGFGASQLVRAGVYILADATKTTQPVIVKKNSVVCAFYGIPFIEPAQVAQLAGEKFDNHDLAQTWMVDRIKTVSDKSVNNILISHCLVLGSSVSDSERTLAVGGTDRVSVEPLSDFDYVALGHLHSPQKCSYDHIRYAGSPLKYSFSEHEQDKSVALVTIDEDGFQSVSCLKLTPKYEVRVLTGLFSELCQNASDDSATDDYVLVKLEDKRAILDAMAQLREYYPNVLHMEKPGIMAANPGMTASRDKLKRGEFHMFRDFYLQMTGEELSVSEENHLRATIDSLGTKLSNQ